MSRLIVALLALSLAACASGAPPSPKDPGAKKRVPVNVTLPAEIHGVSR